jgi:NADH-quinone oxidoreductase subunit A
LEVLPQPHAAPVAAATTTLPLCFSRSYGKRRQDAYSRKAKTHRTGWFACRFARCHRGKSSAGTDSRQAPVVIGLALLIAPFVIAYKNPDPEKLSAYECGFNAFDDARMKFDVRFYLVAILFIIFDLEVAFLFPWAVSFGDIGWIGFWSMMVFLGVLTVGFIYEWKKGALEWE